MVPACTRPERVEIKENVLFSLSGKQKRRPCQEAGGYPGCCAFWGVDGSSGVRDQRQREHKCRRGKIYITLYRIPISSYLTCVIHKLWMLHVLVCVSSVETSNCDYFILIMTAAPLLCEIVKVHRTKLWLQAGHELWSTQSARHTNTSLIEHFYIIFLEALKSFPKGFNRKSLIKLHKQSRKTE